MERVKLQTIALWEIAGYSFDALREILSQMEAKYSEYHGLHFISTTDPRFLDLVGYRKSEDPVTVAQSERKP